MPPLIPLVAGFVALAAGVLVLRTFGPSYRVGRLLASTPEVSVAEARALAASGRPRYVRVRGRIDAEDEFEDDAHRPLVFRRTRLQLRRDGRGCRSRTAGSGCPSRSARASTPSPSTTPRSTSGSWSSRANPSGPRPTSPIGCRRGPHPATPVRLLVEQVSSVEHATVVGVPGLDDAGAPRLTAGLGRPLVLTTLEPAEAMRVLTGGDRRRPLVAVACLAGGVVLIGLGLLAAVVGAVA